MFEDLPTPITIGREDGNVIQLNDERVSRFHAKIQEDRDKIVITDLASTNGTKVNGETVQVALIRPGDVISIGRSTLLVGSRVDIARRLAEIRQREHGEEEAQSDSDSNEEPSDGASPVTDDLEFELNWEANPDLLLPIHRMVPPELPRHLSPAQAAQLSELLQYVHTKLRKLVRSADISRNGKTITLGERQWQNLLDLYDRLAAYLRSIGETEEDL